MTTPTAPETATQHRTVGRSPRTLAQLWQVPTFLAGLLALLTVTVASAFRPISAARQIERDLAAIRQGLKDKAPPTTLVELAESAVRRADDHPECAAEAHFLFGMVHSRLAEQGPADRARDERQRAAQHLDFAEAKGVSAADLPRLQYQLGKLLYQAGELPRAIEYLSRSVAGGADDPAEGYGMLAQAYLSQQPPEIDAALAANEKQIEHTDDEALLAPARLQRADLLLRKGQRGEAIKVLRLIGPAAPQRARLKARYQQAQCCQEDGKWAEAVPLWRELLAEPTAVPGGKARIHYALGLCLAHVEPREDAKAAANWQDAAQQGGEDGQAASLRLAELYLRGSEPASALPWFRRALEKVPSARDYQNFLVSLDEVRGLFETGCRAYRQRQDPEHARELADLYKKLALPGVAEERLAEATEAQAATLVQAARLKTPPEAATLVDRAQVFYREAGALYEQAAAGRLPQEKALRLRHSADCYANAGDYTRAVLVLRQFVDLDPSPDQKAEGWFALAKASQKLRKFEEAENAYQQCIQYDKSPLVQPARFELAQLLIDQGSFDKAEEHLEHSLKLARQAGDHQAREQALYKLGELLFQQGHQQPDKFDKASLRLHEAVRDYPRNPDALWARDRLGECYRRAAEQAKRDSNAESLSADKRLLYCRQMREKFTEARKEYQALAEELERTRASRKLEVAEDALLRKALFLVADCCFELPTGFEEALYRYKELGQRFRGQIEELQATQKLVHCCLLTGDARQAQTALQTARLALEAASANLAQMPEGEFRRAGNRLSRSEWRDLLNNLSGNLATFPQLAPPPKR
jgi:tetratricopeptide (TPR) repeat protein